MARRQSNTAVAASTAVVLSAAATSTLALIAAAMAAEPGYAMLTQAEGEEVVNAGLAALVEPAIIDGDRAAVVLTDAGKAQIAGPADEGSTDEGTSEAPSFVIEDNIPLPGAKRGGRGKTIYPFDALAVNQSFHVPATAENPNPAKSLASTVSSATARYAVPLEGQFEDVKVTTYAVDAAGKRIEGPDGKPVKTGETTERRQKTQNTRVFTVRAVDETDPKGKGARVWRTA